MKVLCGIDIVEVNRIKEDIEELRDKFLNRIFTKKEIEYCEFKKSHSYESFAARFAAKEAIFKAISSLLLNKSDFTWQDIEVLNFENGRPYVNFVKSSYFTERIINIDISLSHEREYATAFVVVTIKDNC